MVLSLLGYSAKGLMRPSGSAGADVGCALEWSDWIRSSVAWSIEPALIDDVYCSWDGSVRALLMSKTAAATSPETRMKNRIRWNRCIK